MAVQFKFTGDDKDVQRALERMEKQYNALIATTKKGTDETKKMAAEAKKAFDDTRTPQERYAKKMAEISELLKQGTIDADTFARASKRAADELAKANKPDNMSKNALAAAAGYLTVATALRGVNTELERKRQLEASAADKQQERANLAREALVNLGTATKAERDEIFAGIKGIAARTGVKETDLLAGLPGLTSAQGAISTKGMLGVGEMAARIAPHNLETMGVLGAGLEATMRAIKTENVEEAMGFQLGVGRRSPVKTLRALNEHIMPGIKNMTGFGFTPSEAAGVVTAMGTTMEDTRGPDQVSAGITLAAQLAEQYPGRKPQEVVEFLRANPAERDRFMKKGAWEKKAFIPTRELLTAGSPEERLAAQAQGDAATGQTAVERARNFLAAVDADPMQRDAQSVRAGAAATEEMVTDDDRSAYTGRVRQIFKSALEASGTGSFMSGLAFDISPTDAVDFATSHLSRRKAFLEQEKALPGVFGDVEGRVKQATTRIEGIEKVIQVLEGIKANQRNRDPDRHAE